MQDDRIRTAGFSPLGVESFPTEELSNCLWGQGGHGASLVASVLRAELQKGAEMSPSNTEVPLILIFITVSLSSAMPLIFFVSLTLSLSETSSTSTT